MKSASLIVVLAIGILIAVESDVFAHGTVTTGDDGMLHSVKPTQGTRDLVACIGVAEGGFDLAGNARNNSVPVRANNPCDLHNGDIGFGTFPDSGGGVTKYPTLQAGLQAAFDKFENIRAGNSRVYSEGMSFRDLGRVFVGTSSADSWAATVVDNLLQLGYAVTLDSPIGDVLR